MSSLEASQSIENPRRLTDSDRNWAELIGTKIGVQLAYGNRDGAIALMEKALAERDNDGRDTFLRVPIASILSVRLTNLIEQGTRAIYVEDLLALEVNELLSLPGFDTRSVIETYRGLAKTAITRLLNEEARSGS